MWYPAVVTVAAASEPISNAVAYDHLGITSDEQSYFEQMVTRLVQGARAHVEQYCNIKLASQTVAVKCDAFEDFAYLPIGPVTSVSSVTYVDTAGATQTLSTDVYEVRAEGLEASIALKYGQSWPSIQPGSRITVTAVVGYAACPADVVAAMLLIVGARFKTRETEADVPWSNVDSLLSNHRRGTA